MTPCCTGFLLRFMSDTGLDKGGVMRKRFITAAAVTVCFIVSCGGGMLPDLKRVLEDPVVESPFVDSFAEEGVIKISWSKDYGADEYVLLRAEDTALPAYEAVFRGVRLCYDDSEVVTGRRYLYALSKIRGEKIFGPSEAVLGAESGIVLDEYEDNGTKEKATLLEWDIQSNLYYYQSYGEEKTEDYDWYRVEVPPRRKAVIVVTQSGISSGGSSWITFYLEGNNPFTVTSGNAVEIPNYMYESRMFYFCISPRVSGFINDPAKGGGGFITYTVSLSQITGI